MGEKIYIFLLREYEKKLTEYMPWDEYKEFASEVAKRAFRVEIEDMPDGDFKDFCLENFDFITRD